VYPSLPKRASTWSAPMVSRGGVPSSNVTSKRGSTKGLTPGASVRPAATLHLRGMKAFALLSFALLLPSSVARAQVAPAPAPPSVQTLPPVQTPPPQAPPPQAPPPQAPQRGQWRPGDPAPPGYHVEEKPRTGLVVAGAILAGVPYFFSVVAA